MGQGKAGLLVATGLIAVNRHIEVIEAPHIEYAVQCIGPDGKTKWEELFRNLVTRAGMADMLDKYFSNGTVPATWYLGLISAAGYSALAKTDTHASHAGWAEYTGYSQAARPTLAWSGATTASDNIDKVASAASAFTINGGGGTVKGCFVSTVSTKGSTGAGTLYSAGLFSADRVVADSDTLNVTPTLRVAV